MFEILALFGLWRISEHTRKTPRKRPIKNFVNEKLGFYGPIDVWKQKGEYWK